MLTVNTKSANKGNHLPFAAAEVSRGITIDRPRNAYRRCIGNRKRAGNAALAWLKA